MSSYLLEKEWKETTDLFNENAPFQEEEEGKQRREGGVTNIGNYEGTGPWQNRASLMCLNPSHRTGWEMLFCHVFTACPPSHASHLPILLLFRLSLLHQQKHRRECLMPPTGRHLQHPIHIVPKTF